eukprot:TRINITY_DN3253_c0_g1_i1.p1 TRINITY_DN3253_c0_g1~~TRINITY_DN3253_c0_g1_i1.p1  ORF type:complete len:200 (+),score=41.32 TRINITY_DN3253_c0_g1_i1:52-651(+)
MESILPPVPGNNFHNVRSEGRLARSTLKDRDKRMKAAMNNKVGKKGRDKNVGQLRQGSGWIDETERLRADSGAEVQRVDRMLKAKRQAKWDYHRSMNQNREKERWDRINNGRDKVAETLMLVAGTDKRNQSSVRYNLINHVYTDSRSAAEATYRDDCTKYLATCRTKELTHRNNLSGYNILTGESSRQIEPPSKPQRPQ